MIVIGIDPSLRNTGIAVVDVAGDSERIIATSVLQTKARKGVLVGTDDARCVCEIADGLNAAIAAHDPVAIVVEAPVGAKAARAARALGLAIATVITATRLRGLPLIQVQPIDVKLATVGRKKADKDDVILAIEQRYPDVPWPDDQDVWEHVADAIGAVIAGLQTETIRAARKMASAA